MEHPNKQVTAVGSLRISSRKQGLQGDSIEDQKEQILFKAKALGLSENNFKFIRLVESGTKKEQPFSEVVEFCRDNPNINSVFIKSIDRNTRGGAGVYLGLKEQLSSLDVTLIDVHGVIGNEKVNTLAHLNLEYSWSVYNPTRMNELLTAERAKDEARDILTRLIGAQAHYEMLGYSARPAQFGLKNQKIDTIHGRRSIPIPYPPEAKWILKMYRMLIEGQLSDKEICAELNSLGYKSRKRRLYDKTDRSKVIGYSGEKPLTPKQLHRYVRNPIYAGIKIGKWTEGKPIKGPFEGLVSINNFNLANRGKITIHKENDQIFLYKGQLPEWQKLKTRHNPLYAYKDYVMCPYCKKPPLGSAPRGKSGKYHPTIHCQRGKHKYFGVNLKKFEATIETFIESIHFSEGAIKQFTDIFTQEWEKRKEGAAETSIELANRLVAIEQEIRGLKEKIKVLESTETIRLFEQDVENLSEERAKLINRRNKERDNEVNVQIALNYVAYYMEHLHELLLDGEDKPKKARLFGLLFETPPTYFDLIDGTPNLSRIFKLNEGYGNDKSHMAHPEGLGNMSFVCNSLRA
jgi:site-specific DNA recombinase